MPIAFVSAMLSIRTLEKNISGLRGFLDYIGPEAETFIEALLPSLALILFMAVLPAVCLKLAHLQLPHSHSSAQVPCPLPPRFRAFRRTRTPLRKYM